MGVMKRLGDSIKKGIRSWLQIQPSNPYSIQIQEVADFELSAIRNRIWYRGDGNELEQMYQQNPEYADKTKFWASRPSLGMEMRKIHTGLPSLIIRTLGNIVIPDMCDFDFAKPAQKELWDAMAQDNDFRNLLERALKETLYIGDGAFKITVDTKISPYPIIEWYPGDRVEYIYERGRLREIVFKTPYEANGRQYVLHEHYGYGRIESRLYLGEKEVTLAALDETKDIAETITFDDSVMLAVQMKVYENAKYQGRGGSIFDGKLDSFDALDEAWSQWMDALRAGRAKTYIPECLVPHDPKTGKLIAPNAFDNRYFAADGDMREGQKNAITTEQPTIPHDSYQATYVTALDLCLQGVISPSTLGIDVKKLDNAEAQREKEKTTLYTRDAIIETLQQALPKLIAACINTDYLLHQHAPEEVDVTISFGEYANPSFESQIETIGKGKTQGIMSIEAAVDELYGDSKTEEWKTEEVARLKAEQGVAELEEPALNLEAGDFRLFGGGEDENGDGRHTEDGAAAKESTAEDDESQSGEPAV